MERERLEAKHEVKLDLGTWAVEPLLVQGESCC